MTFTHHSMQEILLLVQTSLKSQKSVTFEVLNPDEGEGYAGREIVIENRRYLYRGYKAWSDFAELLLCRLSTPKPTNYPLVALTLTKLQTDDSFHHYIPQNTKEKYGVKSKFGLIHKMEEPAFIYYYIQALHNATLSNKKRILNLGINRGDEFEVIKHILSKAQYQKIKLVGIDHSSSAIAYAKMQFKEPNVTLYTHDINNLKALNLGRFDMLISIGTLQSPSINFKPFFMALVQDFLEKKSAIILGFPNSRWIDGQMVYGAKAPNYAMSELSLLYSDVIFCKKYLQQHRYRVTLTGKHYIFLTATKIV